MILVCIWPLTNGLISEKTQHIFACRRTMEVEYQAASIYEAIQISINHKPLMNTRNQKPWRNTNHESTQISMNTSNEAHKSQQLIIKGFLLEEAIHFWFVEKLLRCSWPYMKGIHSILQLLKQWKNMKKWRDLSEHKMSWRESGDRSQKLCFEKHFCMSICWKQD